MLLQLVVRGEFFDIYCVEMGVEATKID